MSCTVLDVRVQVGEENLPSPSSHRCDTEPAVPVTELFIHNRDVGWNGGVLKNFFSSFSFSSKLQDIFLMMMHEAKEKKRKKRKRFDRGLIRFVHWKRERGRSFAFLGMSTVQVSYLRDRLYTSEAIASQLTYPTLIR